MELKEIAAISGKGGLFKIVKPTRTGVILEAIDATKAKLVASASQRVSVLSEISIYTHSQEGSEPLGVVLKKIHAEFGEDTGVSSTSSSEELKAFMKHILPDFDEDRVYTSDIKKLVSWYNILLKEAPELLKSEEVKEKKATKKKETEEPTAEAPVKEKKTKKRS